MMRVLALLTARNLRVALILVPLVFSAAYLWLFSADRYVSESVISLRDSEHNAALEGIASLFSSSGSSTRQELLMLRAYISSGDMLRQLDARLHLRQAFAAPTSDWVFRLPADATQERFLDYYRDRLEFIYDDDANLLEVRTEAFTPDLALAINKEVVRLSEQFINESSHLLAREQMAFAETELETSRQKLAGMRDSVLQFQNKHGLLDPAAQAQASTGVSMALQSELARKETELKALRGYLNDEAFDVQGAATGVAALRAQIAAESTRPLGTHGGAPLNELAGQYQQLLGDLQFAADGYKLSLTAFEAARVESTRKLKSLVLVESPARPQAPENPRRFYIMAALLLGLGLLYGIVRLIVATIEDHQQ
jgi:capsular polysaccharide transport system permease protein